VGGLKFTAIINKEGKIYVSWCPELDIASQGKNVEKALDNLKEAIELYLESLKAHGEEKVSTRWGSVSNIDIIFI
jgi:predicted RNase H-like HicB family nuclease